MSRATGSQRRGVVRLVATVVLLALVAGCALGDLFSRRRSAVETAPAVTVADDDDRLSWAVEEPWFVVVRKSCRTVDVYRHGIRVASYPAVFGLGGRGRKVYEGDLRTPAGLYNIVDSRAHGRWSRFLLLDYPNLQDLHQYWLAMERGRIPRRGERYAGVGGAVGIHGTDKPEKNERGEDWTFGCISLKNADVEDLALLVPVGTPVLIEE